MKTIIDVDERNRIELSELGGKVSYTQFFRMDSGEWVVKGGLMLSPDTAASFGVCLIERAGKEKQMLKPRYQRKQLSQREATAKDIEDYPLKRKTL